MSSTMGLPFAHACFQHKRKLILTSLNADEAALVSGVEIHPAVHLMEVCSHIHGNEQISLHTSNGTKFTGQGQFSGKFVLI